MSQVSENSDRAAVLFAICFAIIISTVSVILRLLSRYITRARLFLDDYLILTSLVFEYGVCSLVAVMYWNGLGTHTIDIPPDHYVSYMKAIASSSFLYTSCITFVKLSVLAFYKRLFPVRLMVLAVNVVVCIVVLWAVISLSLSVLVCIPFRKIWEPSTPGGCLNIVHFYAGMQIPNVITDAVILVMPMRVVWKLHISKTQRFLLLGVFLLGLLTLIFSIVRLAALIKLSNDGSDVTYKQCPTAIWTCIEPAVGITAACLTNVRPLFKWMPWSRNRSSSPANSDSDNSKRQFPPAKQICTSNTTQIYSEGGSQKENSGLFA